MSNAGGCEQAARAMLKSHRLSPSFTTDIDTRAASDIRFTAPTCARISVRLQPTLWDMADGARKRQWTTGFKGTWSDPVGSKLIANAIWAGLSLAALGFAQWRFGSRLWATITSPEWWSTTYDRRQVALWLILPTMLLLVAAWRVGTNRGYKTGHAEGRMAGTRAAPPAAERAEPSEVLAMDERCGLFWRVTIPLQHILSIDVEGASPGYLPSIVDGPFHIKRGCQERMRLQAYDCGSGGTMIYLCQYCDKGGEEDLRDVADSTLSRSLGDVILELQRLTRQNGGTLKPDEGRIQLQQPLYWEHIDSRRPYT